MKQNQVDNTELSTLKNIVNQNKLKDTGEPIADMVYVLKKKGTLKKYPQSYQSKQLTP